MTESLFPVKDLATREGQNLIAEKILSLADKLSPITQLALAEQYSLDSATQAYLSKKDRERAESATQFATLIAADVTDVREQLLQLYEEAISNGTVVAPVVDNTLSEAGKAADSKIVGELGSFLSHRIDDLVIQRKNRIDYNSPDRVEGKRFINYYVDDPAFTVSDWIYIGDLQNFYIGYVAVVAWGDKDRKPIRCIELDRWSLQRSKITVPSGAKYVKVTYQTSYKTKAKLGDFSDVEEVLPYQGYSLRDLGLTSNNFDTALVNQTFSSVQVSANSCVLAGTLASVPKLYTVLVSDGENVIVTVDSNKKVWVRNFANEEVTIDVSVNYIL